LNARPLGYETNDNRLPRLRRAGTPHFTCRKVLHPSPAFRGVSPVPRRLVSESVSNANTLTCGVTSVGYAIYAVDRYQIILNHVHDPVPAHA
jgi:hypothetical protein